MNMPRQTRRLVLACAGLLLAGGPLRAAETAPPAGRVMDLSYEVYLGGMHIFSMDVDMALRSDGYSVAAAGGVIASMPKKGMGMPSFIFWSSSSPR